MAKETITTKQCEIVERKTENEGNSVWNFGMQIGPKLAIQPKFRNFKEEVLGNAFATITKAEWNQTFRKSQAVFNCRIGSKKRIQLGIILKRNHIKLKHILAIKLYSDHDNLQSELRKCFMSNPLQNRISSFYHWRKALRAAFVALSKVSYLTPPAATGVLYHGVKCKSIINKTHGTFYGPLSTTTDIRIARDFAGQDGMVLVMKSNDEHSTHKPLDISLLSEFPHEKEVLLLDQAIDISNHIYSIDYDNHYSYHTSRSSEAKHNPLQLSKQQIVAAIQAIHRDNETEKKTNTNADDYYHIGSNHDEKLNLTLNNDASVYLLCAIYKYAEDFICNLTKYQKGEMNEVLRPFKSISIPKDVYSQFLMQQAINSNQCERILSEFMCALS